MKTFCEYCKNLLDVDTKNNTLQFVCMTCQTIYDSSPDDTLRYEEAKDSNLMIFQTIISNARKDPMSIKEKVTCPKCKHGIAKQVRLGEEMRLINICEKCGFQWVGMK